MSVRELFNRFYDFAQRKIVPELRYSQYHYEDVLGAAVEGELDWLDVGCGHHMLPPWHLEAERDLIERARNVVGLDVDFPSLEKHKTIARRVQATVDALPFARASFDLATANMVIEHFDNPRVQFAEIGRVLRPGGAFIFHTVNELGYFARLRRLVPKTLVNRLAKLLDGRAEDDVFEVHYRANSPRKIAHLAQQTGFEVEKIQYISSGAILRCVPPLAVIELFWLRFLRRDSMQKHRTNIIVTLRKKPTQPE